MQVKTKSLADARRHFDRLKRVLEGEPYCERISWHEGDSGTIDALDIVSLLMIYYPPFSEDADGGEPYGVYGHKNRCLDAYLAYADKQPHRLEAWITIVPKLVELFDEIQVSFPKKYPGTFGKITDVRIYDETRYEAGNKRYRKTPFKSKFLDSEMKYSSPIGFVYPVFAAFRVLVAEDGDRSVAWKTDPIRFWEQHGSAITEQFQAHMRQFEYASQRIAKSLTCYQATRHAVNDCYKDQLLREAGIDF